MIELIYSNKTERLLGELARRVMIQRESGGHPLKPVDIVVPNRNMESWVRLGLAQWLGVAANFRFGWLNQYIERIFSDASSRGVTPVDLDTVEAAVLVALMDEKLLSRDEMRPVLRYLKDGSGSGGFGFDENLAKDGADLRRVQLAARMAFLFQEYSFSRPEMIALWRGAGGGAAGRSGSPHFSPYADPGSKDSTVAATVGWQRGLWQAVFGPGGILDNHPPEVDGRWVTMDLPAFDDGLFRALGKKELPPVHIFGLSYMARIFQHLFARLGEVCELKIYSLNPCAEFWEDVESDRAFSYRLREELRRRDNRLRNRDTRLWVIDGRKGEGEDDKEDPFGIFAPDTPALRYWGRPGREHVHLLGELTDCDFTDAFESPLDENNSSILNRLQLDILKREPERDIKDGNNGKNGNHYYNGESCEGRDNGENGEGGKDGLNGNNVDDGDTVLLPPDDSIRIVAAPSVRREVEWVSDEIWRLMSRDDDKNNNDSCSDGGDNVNIPLRFSDIAIIVNSASRDIYLPQIDAVFSANHNLPCSVSDLPGSAGSRIIEAMGLLLKLPFGRLSRAEMLNFMGHPAVIGGFDDLRAEDFAVFAERLGIVFGAHHQEHKGTYIDEDVFNWDQGIRRLALGSFMTGEKSGGMDIFEAGEGGSMLLVEEVASDGAMAAARFGLLARSLLADALFVRNREMSLSGWLEFYRRQIKTYFQPTDSGEVREAMLLSQALVRLESMDLGGMVSGRVAAEIAGRIVEELEGGRGRYLAEGVVVSSFLPMRAIPFRVVFVLGLGEGLFPASAQRDALDLRAVRRRAGDVDPAERDRYMFLETLLCTRDKFYLSYVGRDEHTGEPLQPSAVVQELLHMLKLGYLGEEGVNGLSVEPPLALRRYDEDFARRETFLDEAIVEARIREIAVSSKEGRGDVPGERPTPLPDLSTILMAMPENRAALSEMLNLPGEKHDSERREREGADDSPVSLSVPVLRAFLECPMQGWAKAVLGLEGDGDDFADVEEEDFEIGRMAETSLLNAVIYESLSGGLPPDDIYRQKALRLRLAGKIPVGDLGRILERHHLNVLDGWLEVVEGMQEAGGREVGFSEKDTNEDGDVVGHTAEFSKGDDSAADNCDGSGDDGRVAFIIERLRFGHSYRHETATEVLDPLLLKVPVSGCGDENAKADCDAENSHEEDKNMISVSLGGLLDGLFDGRKGVVLFRPKKFEKKKDENTVTANIRYFLRGVVGLELMAAAGVAGTGERQVVICYSDGENSGAMRFTLKPASQEKAQAWLADVVAELYDGPHDYLLPYEAVFKEFWRRNKDYFLNKKSGDNNPEPKASEVADKEQAMDNKDDKRDKIDGEAICGFVRDLVGKERSNFSSDWGPVPYPRSYEPPDPDKAAEIAERMMRPLLDQISGVEVF